MIKRPDQPKIYHITHVKNLAEIVKHGSLVSDREMVERGGPVQTIGLSAIKRRRIEEIVVTCHPGTHVGDYVPFYFCPRSVMLYVIHRANHPDLTYRDGQGPITHLEADLNAVVRWAEADGRRWAFSLSNAGSFYCEFRSRLDELDQLDWAALEAEDFRDPVVKERKQAEFLVFGRFPFHLVTRIGVQSDEIRNRVAGAIKGAGHQPAIEVQPDWYF